MKAVLSVVLLIAVAFAGCSEAPADEDPIATPAAVPDGLAIFGGITGPVDDLLAEAGDAVHFLTDMNGPEPNMGITSQGNIFVSAYSNIIRSQDDGETWEIVHTHQLMNSDPMMWVDPWTDCIYNVPMFPILLGGTIYESCDEGETWTTIHSQNVGRGVYDHQKFASALPGPDAPPGVGQLHPTTFIICYNALAYTNCAVSFDGGITWPHDGPIWQGAASTGDESGQECAGQQSHPTGAPDGTIVVAKAWGCDDPWVFVSTDNGVTWEQRKGPTGVGADTLDPEIAFTDDGAMYMLWQSKRDESRAHLARSEDMGRTWQGPWDVTPPGMNSTIFAALHAGSPGRVAMSFHATDHTGAPVSVDDDARWHTYIVTSSNADEADPTFISHRVQPADEPIQVGGICKGNRGCTDGNRNLLDFIDGAIHPDGRFFTVYADGCLDACHDATSTPSESRGRTAAVARLDGWSLYA